MIDEKGMPSLRVKRFLALEAIGIIMFGISTLVISPLALTLTVALGCGCVAAGILQWFFTAWHVEGNGS